MTDFLLELLSEEIPARMQDKACKDLQALFEAEIAKAGLKAAAVETYATPRRLALIARGLPAATDPVREETKGPRASAPPQALEGFLRKTGLSADQLTTRDGILYAIVEKPGRATAQVLTDAIPAVIRAFPWPKSMRWGEASRETTSLRWVRPLKGILALLEEDIVPFEVAGVASGAATVGHRFHHPGPITIGSAGDYVEKLRACHVILDPAERRGIIEGSARALAETRGLHVIPDPGLVAENAGLTEWPVPLLGAFDPAFLEVPREVIQLTMRTNQKYFALVDGKGTLAPNFICTANIAAADGGEAIVAGNRKVLAARLADARFFWEQDLKVPLARQAEKLAGIVFHEKLGTVADKVDRVAKLARWLVEEEIIQSSPHSGEGDHAQHGGGEKRLDASPAAQPLHLPAAPGGPPPHGLHGEDRARLADMAEQAARLCKADLVTGMVGEFPELQGIMGGYYARAEGLPPEVADAIRDHYKPVGQGDEVPTAPVTMAVSLADKLDTLAAFFALGELPTGSRDPFALRRAALGVISLLLARGSRVALLPAFHDAVAAVLLSVMERAALLDPNYGRYVEEVRRIAPDRSLPASEFRARLKELRSALGEFEIVLQPFTQLIFDFVKDTRRILDEVPAQLLDFFADRLKVQQREAGVRHDFIDAVFALGGEDDLVRLLARVKALQAFVATGDGANLLAGYKRAANILKKEGYDAASTLSVIPAQAGIHREAEAGGREGSRPRVDDEGETSAAAASPSGLPPPPIPLSYTPEKEEADLLSALDAAEAHADAAIAREDFEGAMGALAGLRRPIDAFFDKVTVNDPAADKRAARLAMLARVRAAVHRVADFSKIEG